MIMACVVLIASLSRVYGQSLNVCNTLVVDSANDVWQTTCITEWNTTGTPQINGYVEVDTSNGAYLPAVDAEMILGGMDAATQVGSFLGQADANPILPNNSMQLFDDEVVGVTAAMTPNTVYEVNAGFGECYDPTGNYGYNVEMDQTGYCGWTDYSQNPTYTLGTNFFNPSAQVVSVLYAPPGDKSTTGYTSGTTNGTTTSVGNSFQQANEIAFSGGLGPVTVGVSYKKATQTGTTDAYQTQLTSLVGISELANARSQYNSNNLDMPTRLWDSFVLLLNSEITTASDDSGTFLGYSADMLPVSGEGWTIQPAFSEAVAEDMINGTVPENTLNQRPLPIVGQTQYYLPGLASTCKNQIKSEYSAGTCSDADQCGCQKADFSSILGQDTLLRWDKIALIANPMPAYESPLDADVSGNTACQNPNSNLDCNYVPVPTSQTNHSPQIVELNYAFANSFTQTDATSTSITLQDQKSYTVSLSASFGFKLFDLVKAELKDTNSWTWTDTNSTGTIMGTQNQMNVTLQTDNPGCVEENYVYEDTRYHTFVVEPPQNVPNCKH